MEFNTSERRINEDVVRILEEGKLEYAVSEVAKTQRYQLIKIADAEKYLTATEFVAMFDALEPFLKKIEEGRLNEGKTSGNDYIVINRDEPYIDKIIDILAANKHWDGPRTGIFKRIAEKQNEYYNTLPNQIRKMINDVEGADITYKGKRAIVLCVYTDSTADVLIEDENGNEFERNVRLTDL